MPQHSVSLTDIFPAEDGIWQITDNTAFGRAFSRALDFGWVEVAQHDDTWTAQVWSTLRAESGELILTEEFTEDKGQALMEKRRKFDSKVDDLAKSLGYDVDPSNKRDESLAVQLNAWAYDVLRRGSLKARFQDLTDRIESLEIHSAGGMIPFQSEGVIEGMPYYFRYRHGVVSLRVGHEPVLTPLYTASVRHGDPLGGFFSNDEEFMEIFARLIPELAVAPLFWKFTGIVSAGHPYLKEGEQAVNGAWGFTAEEAWEKIAHLDDFEDEKEKERWARTFKAENLNPASITKDERIFPEEHPDWANLVK